MSMVDVLLVWPKRCCVGGQSQVNVCLKSPGGGGTRSEKGYQLWSDRHGAVAVAPRDG